jgi:peptidoglycan/LPS O-acetylase OafA/YrhL
MAWTAPRPTETRREPGLLHPKYRPDIDGLRAIAVVSVIGFHAFPTWIKGGFIGVDIFFVISGFLISSIIFGNLECGSFSYTRFYARRIKRIFPALLLVLAFTWLLGWDILLPPEYRQLGTHVTGGAGFVSNFVLWRESGYFDAASDTKPLLHLWSLGIEEQFYLAWPLILAFAWRRKRGALAAIVLILMASFALSVAQAHSAPTAAFYSPLSRAWELMVGSALAYALPKLRRGDSRHSDWQSVAGFALIAVSLATITVDKPFPGWWAVLPTVGALLLILAGPDSWLNRHVLANRVMVWVGLISYPLYLWHWPLLSYGRIVRGDLPGRSMRFLLIAAAAALASMTYVWFERPFRHIENWNRAVTSLVAVLCLFVGAGLAIHLGLQPPRLRDSGVGLYMAAMGDWDFPSRAFQAKRIGFDTVYEIRTPSAGTTLFVGDSLMQQYGPRVESVIARDPGRYNSVVFATAGGCPPIPGVYGLPRQTFYPCESMRAAAFKLAESRAVTTVVFGTDWYGIFDPTDDDSRLVFVEAEKSAHFPASEAIDLAYASLGRMLAEFSRSKRVFVVLPTPTGRPFDPRAMVEGSRFRKLQARRDIEPIAISSWLAGHLRVRKRLLSVIEGNGATAIDPSTTLCPNAVCPVLDSQGRPLYKDGLHMRPFYVRENAGYIDQTFTVAPSVADRQR